MIESFAVTVRHLLSASLVLAWVGCASPPDLGADGGVDSKRETSPEWDALVGTSASGGGTAVPNSGPGGPGLAPGAGGGAAPPPPPPPPPSGCVPGSRTGLCGECGPDGLPRMTEDDNDCPQVPCESFDFYTRRREGDAWICDRTRHRPIGGRCLSVGMCRANADADFCPVSDTVEVQRSSGPCEALDGCNAQSQPQVRAAEAGTPCGDGMACDEAGQCVEVEVDERCGLFANRWTCGGGVHTDGSEYCEVSADDGDVRCADVCREGNGFCLGAWTAPGDNPCRGEEQVGCFDAVAAVLCRCGGG